MEPNHFNADYGTTVNFLKTKNVRLRRQNLLDCCHMISTTVTAVSYQQEKDHLDADSGA